jgi:hypothetical protein
LGEDDILAVLQKGLQARGIDSGVASVSGNGAHDPNPRFKAGHSLAWYANRAIDETQTLLGNRYLCRSGGMFVVAPSGMGKSTVSLQMAVLWCCGLPAIGIKPRGKLRILIVQSEDDEGDCIEMSRVMNHLELEKQEKDSVDQNTKLVRCNDLVSSRFIEALRVELQQAKDDGKPFDLVIINPYGVFLGDDVKNTKATTTFLNEWLNPVLSEFGIGAVIIHHTPKTNFQSTDNYKIWDWMYWGAGCASISNWARAILAIKPEGDDMSLFRFIAAKRGKRIGEEWADSFEKYFSWSTLPGVLRWETASAKQIATATAHKGARHADLDTALGQVPAVDPERKTTVLSKIREACRVGEKLAEDALNQLIDSEKVQEITIKNKIEGRRGYAGVVRSSANDE